MNYAMDNTQILSPKPSIDEALAFLGMSDMDKAMGISALLRICKDGDLPLFFDERLTCVPTSIKYGDQYDDEGEWEDYLFIDPKDSRELWLELILGNFNLHVLPNNSFDLIVSKIIHADVSYHIYQTDGTLSEGESVGYEKFYFDRAELIKFKAEYTSHYSERSKEKVASSQRESVQDRRTTAFKYWLVGNSGKSIHKDEDLQDCYEKLGAPTKEKIWQELSLMDNKLFAAGKDDFLKAMSSVIQFKIGTSKGRDL